MRKVYKSSIIKIFLCLLFLSNIPLAYGSGWPKSLKFGYMFLLTNKDNGDILIGGKQNYTPVIIERNGDKITIKTSINQSGESSWCLSLTGKSFRDDMVAKVFEVSNEWNEIYLISYIIENDNVFIQKKTSSGKYQGLYLITNTDVSWRALR